MNKELKKIKSYVITIGCVHETYRLVYRTIGFPKSTTIQLEM